MIDYPDNDVVESFARMRHDPDFARIIDWFRSEEVSIARRAMIMEPQEVARMQGAYLAIHEILKVADDAVNVINAAHERKKKGRTHIP